MSEDQGRGRSDEGAARAMPAYRSHKIVHALRIKMLYVPAAGSPTITPEEAGYGDFTPPQEWWHRTLAMLDSKGMRHDDLIGGYYVVYDGGYTSWSPKEAFEDGYTRID